jgi:hypothetical protein
MLLGFLVPPKWDKKGPIVGLASNAASERVSQPTKCATLRQGSLASAESGSLGAG